MAVFSGTMMNSTTEFLSGCITGCFSESDVSSKCEGLGCCQASIPDGVSNITLKAGTIMNHTYVVDFNPCSVAFVVAKDHLQQSHSDEMLFTIQSFLKKDVSLYKDASELLYPAVYDWSIGTKDCKSAKAEGEQLLCKGNTKCVDDLPGQWGYRCECKPGFTGINPYLHDCQDINECADNGLHNCEKQEYCHNNPGSYRCQCPQSFNGNGTKESPCVRIQKKVLLPMESIIILGSEVVLMRVVDSARGGGGGNGEVVLVRLCGKKGVGD
uniref:EGF-like domain-containing protein n=1 Tax=Chenopodium quinoa TaxID=63459 RepID=A0A803M5H6_CHEQI